MPLIDRNRCDEHGQPIKPSDKWFRKAAEKQKEIVTNAREGKTITFDPGIYADKREIRPILEQLFYGKCWYCEWKPTRNDWDVEHFRPKSRVREDPSHPGYYWLCYEWTNLYMSCQYCNQGRRDSPKHKALGKRDQFPLENGSPRTTEPNCDINQERCLLIDPCKENPGDYIVFGIDGVPIDIENNEKGKMSIEVFHLDQVKSNRARNELMSQYIEIFDLLARMIKLFNNSPQNQELKDAVEDLTQMFNRFTLDSAEFATAIRAIRKHPIFYGITDEKAEIVERYLQQQKLSQ